MLDIVHEYGILAIVRALWAPSLLTGAVFTLVGLVSVWAASSSRHWFLRALVMAAVLSPTLTIGGNDAALVFLLQSMVAIVGIRSLKALHTRFPRAELAANSGLGAAPDSAVQGESEHIRHRYIQFSLLDLMLTVLVVAAVCGLLVQMPPHLRLEWPAILIAGISFGGLTIWMRREFAAAIFRRNRPRWLGRTPIRGKPRFLLRLFVSVIIPFCTLLLLCPISYLYHRAINPLPRPTIAMPVPNGYDDLERAHNMLFGGPHANAPIPDPGAATRKKLATFGRDDMDALDTIRLGLSRECRVRLSYSQSELYTRHTKQRQLMQALLAEGRLAEYEDRLDDAVTCYLDVVRLARKGSHGGIITDVLTAVSIQETGVEQLLRITDALDHREAKRAIDSLQGLNMLREPMDSIIARDRIFVDQMSGKLQRASLVIWESSPQEVALRAATCEHLRFLAKRDRVRTQLAVCEMAVRRYQLDHDRPPDTLAELVPEYLGSVPEDPFVGQPIVYRPDSAGPILYSVGPDGCDDGGRPIKPLDWRRATPISWRVTPGDVLLREPEYMQVEAE